MLQLMQAKATTIGDIIQWSFGLWACLILADPQNGMEVFLVASLQKKRTRYPEKRHHHFEFAYLFLLCSVVFIQRALAFSYAWVHFFVCVGGDRLC